MSLRSTLTPETVLDSINEGVYVTDTARKIVYWGKAAERITGWSADEMIGKCCADGLLCHIDKDGHRLCGEEHCPLHRCMRTGQSSHVPIILFARTKSGGHVPLQVAVSPLRDAAGAVVGGVENFRDLSGEFADIERARKIQMLTLSHDLPADPRIRFTARYVPCDIIGGDYYAFARLGADQYGFLLADITGHGLSAALYTMYLSSLWASHRYLLTRPARFAKAVNDRLNALIEEDEPFAAALCGVFDLQQGELRLVGAGNPPPLVIRASGVWESPDVRGVPLRALAESAYEDRIVPVASGDCVLFFTDGAVDVTDAHGTRLGLEGLKQTLRYVGYPGSGPAFDVIEAAMLRASDRIRFEDDVTFVDVRLT